MDELPTDIVYLTVIAGRNQKDILQDAMIEKGCKLIHIAYGRGSVKAGFLQDMLGLVHEEHKVIITCLLRKCNADTVISMLSEKFSFDKKNTGIAFTIPVQNLSF